MKKEIHHHPSKGGTNENHKHEEWYAETLEAYKEFFIYNPPEDIWPHGITQASVVTEEPEAEIKNIEWYKGFLSLLLIPLFVLIFFFQKIIPFNLTGSQFLVFYITLAITTLTIIVLAGMKKARYVKALLGKYYDTSANIYQLSRFVYSREKSVRAAIVDLTGRKILDPGKRSYFTVYPSNYYYTATESNPLLPALLKDMQEGQMIAYGNLRNYYNDDLTFNSKLSSLYKSLPRRDILGILLIAFVTMIGVLRIFQGAANEKPYNYLLAIVVIFLLASVVVLISMSCKVILETVFKDQFRYGNLESQLQSSPLANSFVFAGLTSISMMVGYSYLYNTFSRENRDTGWSSSSGCGSSGCVSDGGGGCGGGGCGGCGGGD